MPNQIRDAHFAGVRVEPFEDEPRSVLEADLTRRARLEQAEHQGDRLDDLVDR